MHTTEEDDDADHRAMVPLPLTPTSEASVTGHVSRNKSKVLHSKSCKRVPDRQQRSQDEAIFWQAINEISSPALHAAQLTQSFISTYLSPDVREAHGQFFQTFYWESPQSRSLQAARGGLCLTHLGLRCKHCMKASRS